MDLFYPGVITSLMQSFIDGTPLHTGSEERGVLGVEKYSCCNTSLLSRYGNLRHNCINMNIVG